MIEVSTNKLNFNVNRSKESVGLVYCHRIEITDEICDQNQVADHVDLSELELDPEVSRIKTMTE